jgi:hypothetical protein
MNTPITDAAIRTVYVNSYDGRCEPMEYVRPDDMRELEAESARLREDIEIHAREKDNWREINENAIKENLRLREQLQLAKVENNHNWAFQPIHEETLKKNTQLRDALNLWLKWRNGPEGPNMLFKDGTKALEATHIVLKED